jgi:dTDP-4-amino-4,6-dideoxygalactose transaminase
MPDDLAMIEKLARAHGVYMIDDAAQSLGAAIQDRPVGGFGDAGVLSFDKGKVITTINGGAIVVNNPELTHDVQKEHSQLQKQAISQRTTEVFKLLVYALLLHPALYWIPSHMPFLRLGETRYDDTYPVARYFDALAPLAMTQMSRLNEINEHRRWCAARYTSLLADLPVAESIESLPASEPVYLRYPIRILDPDKRARFLAVSRKLGCSISYPSSVADIPQIRDHVVVQNDMCEAGREVASQLVTLPTHAYVTEQDIDVICSELAT